MLCAHRPSAPGSHLGHLEEANLAPSHPSSRGTPPQAHAAPSNNCTSHHPPFQAPHIHTGLSVHRPHIPSSPALTHSPLHPRGPRPHAALPRHFTPRRPHSPASSQPTAAGGEGRAGGLRRSPAPGGARCRVGPAVLPLTHLRGHGAAGARAGQGCAAGGTGADTGPCGAARGDRRCPRCCCAERRRRARPPRVRSRPAQPGPPRGGGDGLPPLPPRSPWGTRPHCWGRQYRGPAAPCLVPAAAAAAGLGCPAGTAVPGHGCCGPAAVGPWGGWLPRGCCWR